MGMASWVMNLGFAAGIIADSGDDSGTRRQRQIKSLIRVPKKAPRKRKSRRRR